MPYLTTAIKLTRPLPGECDSSAGRFNTGSPVDGRLAAWPERGAVYGNARLSVDVLKNTWPKVMESLAASGSTQSPDHPRTLASPA